MERIRMARQGRRRLPQQHRSRQKVEAILDAGAQVLVDVGLEKASTNRIARQAGVSIGTLYQYFDSKEAVLDALCERETSRLIQGMVLAFGPAPDLQTLLERAPGVMVEYMPKTPGLFRAMMQLPACGFRDRLDAAKVQFVELLRQVMERHRDELAGPLDVDEIAQTIVHAGEGLMLNDTDGDWEATGRRITSVISSMLRGHV
jgi:AcrR family transcriptional regulator